MANLIATITLIDSYNRTITKRVETETPVIATAKTAIEGAGLLADDLAAVTDLGLVTVAYSTKDADAAFAVTAGANRDVGATFRLRTTDGGVVSYKIPGFKVSLANADGSIDPTDAAVVAYFGNFLAGGDFTLSDGETVSAILSGQLDK